MNDVKRRQFWQQSIGDQTSHEMGHEIGAATMTGVLDLALILENVIDRFDQGTLAQQGFIEQRHQLVFHVLFDFRDQLQAVLPQLVEQRLGNVTLVAEQFARERLGHCGHGSAVIDIASG